MLRVIALIAIAGLVSGCTGAQIESARMQKATAATAALGKSCLERVYAKPEYEQLRTKMFLSTETIQFPLQYLTDESKPTKAQIADLYKLHGEVQECRKIVLDGISGVHPLVVATLIDSFSEQDRLWVEAVSGKLTWGKFHEARQASATQYLAKLTETGARIDAQLQSKHQFEIQQRQRAAEAMQQWAYQQQQLYQNQQIINAANQPRMINCNYFGNTARCSSF